MSLKKYNSCDSTHYEEFQYVCLREKKVFCLKCWFKMEHFRHCQSTRCGPYTKIAHLTLNRALQYKNSKILQSMGATPATYEALRVRFLQFNFQVTEVVKQFVQQKMPLLFWSMCNDLLKTRVGPDPIPDLNKFDSYCSDMIKIIKNSSKSMHLEYLESAIGAYYEINHQLEGELVQIRASGFRRNNHKEDLVNQVLDKTKTQLFQLLSDIKKGFRKVMDEQFQKSTKIIDNSTKFKGITFQKITNENQCFRKRQQYPYLNLITQTCSRISNEETDLHMGFNMNMGELQCNPQQLLQLGKCFIKQKLHSIYENITTVKSLFPYKYAYPISTTISQDHEYEQLIIDLQRTVIDAPDKANPFMSSLILTIIGREVIVIRFYNQPKFSYTRKIYNYKKDREGYYDLLIEKFGLKGIAPKMSPTPEYVEFSEELTDVELAYCNFRIAFQNIFLSNGQDIIFEGEKVMANRGAEQFSFLVEKSKKFAKIDLQFSSNQSEMIKYFI